MRVLNSDSTSVANSDTNVMVGFSSHAERSPTVGWRPIIRHRTLLRRQESRSLVDAGSGLSSVGLLSRPLACGSVPAGNRQRRLSTASRTGPAQDDTALRERVRTVRNSLLSDRVTRVIRPPG